MPIRAILFDFDGTLADSFAAIASSTNQVRRSCGLPELPEQEIRASVGFGLPQLLRELVPTLSLDDSIARYRSHHDTIMREQTRLYPGVLETLRRLHDSGLGLAICSNKAVQFTQDLVQNLGLSPYISEVLGPESVGAAKPDPAMLLEACRRLKVSREEAIYVGDMSIDVHAGQAAGIPVYLVNVGVAGRDDPRQLGPEKVLNDFTELQAFAESGPRATA